MKKVRKKKVERKAFVVRKNYPPVDFSFRELGDMDELKNSIARSGKRRILRRRKRVQKESKQAQIDGVIIRPKRANNKEKEDSILGGYGDDDLDENERKKKNQEEGEEKKKILSKYLGEHLKLSNNEFNSIKYLKEAICEVLERPFELKILDLSFNEIGDFIELCEELQHFPEIRVLYLHGNLFEEWNDLGSLKCLPNLRTITLHGNPLDQYQNYRLHALAEMRQLRSIDFSTVTNKERETAQNYSDLLMRKKKKKKEKVNPFYN